MGRDVAIKVLPRELCNNPDRVARFEREARLLAALNHPHIASIHGLEQVQGSAALVLELVEGPTLADRIANGALPLDEAIPIATQIAEALAAAHEKGVIHRDLKPANIKIRVDGNVKVLDFGLARMISEKLAPELRNTPSFLPDGRHFVFVTYRAKQEDSEICVGSLGSQESRCIMKVPSPARYAPPGFLLFGRDGVLRVQRFDAEDATLSGEAVPVSTREVRVTPVYRPPPFSITATVLAFHPGIPRVDLVWRDRTGASVSRLPVLGDSDHANWSASPDGRLVVTSLGDVGTDDRDIWVYDEQRGTWMRFTFNTGATSIPRFSPDGSRFVFTSTRAGVEGFYVKPTSGAGSEQLLATRQIGTWSPSDWSSDGQLILYASSSPKTSWDIGVIPADGRTPPKLIINSQHGERSGKFSADTKWIAYDSTESGRREVWIQPYPPSGDRWQVSNAGGVTPQWRRDGKELFYVRGDGMLMVVPIGGGTAPAIGAAMPLFQTFLSEGGAGYSVSPDGQRFLMGVPPSGLDVAPITVRVNWRTAFEQR